MLKNSLKVFVYLLSIGVILLNPNYVSAHVLKTSGSIGAVLHIDPDDDPIIGQPATFLLEFKDSEGDFNLHNCVCTYTVSKSDQTASTGNLLPFSDDDHTSATFGLVFPEKGVYNVEIAGVATDNSFSEFKLSYDQRVSRESESDFNIDNLFKSWEFFALVGVLLIFILLLLAGPIRKKLLS